ncbi:glycosyltransferase [Ornithobacterium rhinotracheale]|uniref:Glycosyltransferase n=1 Tax=Ornithobacterium rhinotracheale TaxID=28251 RepID=A0A3R5XUQ8_ORNRH|nr:glycosyltransferase [Ornithobacterium rhinotracheale]QAR30998.1 glycosyltransferase [Ornithobacterium rhinotracheale]
MKKIKFSIIIAVYNRAAELHELLQSLAQQTYKDFEIIVVDDGSTTDLQPVIQNAQKSLKITYYYKPNSGAGLSRNYGMKRATGDYFIFFDSDTLIPANYLEHLHQKLSTQWADFYGGADTAGQEFTPLQKAINYSMTATATTGGIRSAKNSLGKFQPRSFNMGLSRQAFQASGGFSSMRIGEDPELSMRLWQLGFQSASFPELKVMHKRRNTLKSFAQQVRSFGRARPILNRLYPSYTKPTYWLPTFFCLGFLLALALAALAFPYILYLYALYFACVLLQATIQNRSLQVGALSLLVVALQFANYGYGFLESQIKINLLKQEPQKAFPRHF